MQKNIPKKLLQLTALFLCGTFLQLLLYIPPTTLAQTERYRRTKILTAAGTTLIEQQPYTVHSTITGQNQPWLLFPINLKTIGFLGLPNKTRDVQHP
ncbi:DUF3131 domain-containing protein [Nostoc sp. CCY0012]|uniref:DUF3131 domain-containing protein n=1 Tax=Nostoc sp. CCY0012 TaxID=1056123 RepID=UPI0039C65108